MKTTIQKNLYVMLGSIIFSASVNLFLLPEGIFNGGFTGVAQLVSNAFIHFFNISQPVNLVGIFNLMLNVPVFIFAWNRLSKNFVMLNLVSILTQTIALTLIPIPQQRLVADPFIGIAVGAILGAFGASLTYKVRGAAGGLDIVGFYYSQYKKISVGNVFLVVNAIIYAICGIIYNLQTAIYSLTCSFIYSYFLDKFHEHNLEASLMVFTKNTEVKKAIIQNIHRGVTHWDGFGAYTGTKLDVFMTIVAQSEVNEIKALIKHYDPSAFIVVTKNLKTDGNFEKRLI